MTTNDYKIYRQETLDNKRIPLLKYFKDFKEMGFYLAWWTWLSLLIWHRNSIDFDFFCFDKFNSQILLKKISKLLWHKNLIIENIEQNTLNIIKNWVQISFMTYSYPMIWKFIKTDFFDIASIEDIWAMKLAAIQGRAVNKDYIDLYFIIKRIWLPTLFSFYKQKFQQNITDTLLLKYIIAFEDVETNPIIMNNKIKREDIKIYLQKKVNTYLKEK